MPCRNRILFLTRTSDSPSNFNAGIYNYHEGATNDGIFTAQTHKKVSPNLRQRISAKFGKQDRTVFGRRLMQLRRSTRILLSKQ